MIFEKQEYQKKCINNITALLKEFDFKEHRIGNLKECFEQFYKEFPQPIQQFSNKRNIDILMETGTGKTFTYLNLIFELHKNYKQNKFIIFVPRKAILESVRQNIELTKDYFCAEYQKHLKPYYYTDSKSQSLIINHYIKNEDELSVLILTNSAIDKKENLLHKNNEKVLDGFDNKSVFESIVALKPIAIIDEPHLLKGKAFNGNFSKLNTLYFRFGATFPKEDGFELSNMVYSLDSICAFREYLVKQIRVHSLGSYGESVFLTSVNGKGKSKQACFSYYRNGVQRQEIIKIGDSLSSHNNAILTNLKDNKAYFNDNTIIGKEESYTLDEDDMRELLRCAITQHFEKEEKLFKRGIKALSLFFIPSINDFRGDDARIKKEFEKIYKEKREEVLNKSLSKAYREYLEKDFNEDGELCVHQGYFSGDSNSINKKNESNKENLEANDIRLILKDKEKLLSFDSSLRFIFSVWALQEGWDNPNIFTLTKLSHTQDISTHQQVGRGLRLCVNRDGKRITHSFLKGNDEDFYAINCVDIIVSARELNFIERLQNEIDTSSYTFNGKTFTLVELENLLKNQNLAMRVIISLEDRGLIRTQANTKMYDILAPLYEALQDDEALKGLLKNQYPLLLNYFKGDRKNREEQIKDANQQGDLIEIKPNLAKDFKELWDTINKQASIVYKDIHDEYLVQIIADNFNRLKIEKEQICLETKVFDPKENKIIIQDSKVIASKDYSEDFERNISTQLLEFARDEKIPLRFLLQIYNKLNKDMFSNSPKTSFSQLKHIIKESLHANLLQVIGYNFTDDIFTPSYAHLVENGKMRTSVTRSVLGQYISTKDPASHYLYKRIAYDSKIEEYIAKEQQDKVDGKCIKVFAKLPKFRIPTPYKEYEPDFAYFLEGENGLKIFFVCESKGYDNVLQIPENEQKKIEYAEIFFKCLQEHLKDKNIQIIFNKRINKQTLLNSLEEAIKNSTIKDDNA